MATTTSVARAPCWDAVKSVSSDVAGGGQEWYAPFATLKPLLQEHLQYTDSCLVLTGPQASCLHEQLYASGYRGMTAVHSSSEVVQAWRQKHLENQATLTCQVADIAEGLAFEHVKYNVIIDVGTLDAVLCRETGLHLAQDAAAGWRTVYNNLKAPGTFILLTHGPPSLRRPLLDQLQWSSITVKAVVPQTTPTAASQAGKPGKSAPAVDALQLVDAALEDAAAAYVYVCKKPYS